MRRNALTTTTIALSIALAAMLGGCSTGNSEPKPEKTEKVEEAKEQTVKQGCVELGEASTDVGQALTDATSQLADDPAAAAAAITEATATYEEEVDEIENDEVRESAAPLILGLTHFAEAIATVAADPTAAGALDAVTASSTEVNDALLVMGEVCG